MAPSGLSPTRRQPRVVEARITRGAQGHAKTVVASGRFAASLISPREFDRLRRLHRIASWFAAAGVDLGAGDEPVISAFVRDYRAGTKAESAVG